jgi:hypothetical protein
MGAVDIFTVDERSDRRYRVLAARFVSPESIGFTNELFQQWPSILYPLLYPWLTAIIGALALVVATRNTRAAATT